MAKVKLANGIDMEYEERGQGEPLLLIHGSGASWPLFEPLFPALATQYRLIMPHMRGHGASSPLVDGRNYHQVMAEDVKLFLDAIGINKPINVYGVSMGGVIALRLAISYPEYVAKLISVCAYSEMPGMGGEWLVKASNAVFSLFSMQSILKLMFAAAYPLKLEGSALTREVVTKSMAVDKPTFFKLKENGLAPFTDQLSRIKAPTLLMAGTRMAMEEKASRLIASKIPGARLALFKGATDPVHTHRLQIHNEMFLDFLAGRALKEYPGVTYVD